MTGLASVELEDIQKC